MKQFYILTCMLAFLATSAQNNSIKIISQKTGQVLNGTVDTIYGDGAVNDITRYYNAVMESQASMLVGIKRVELAIIAGTADYFCWFLCYGPVNAGTLPVWNAADSLTMTQNDTISNLSVYLKPKGNLGVANYRYIFFPENNPTDSSWFDVVFNIVTLGREDYSTYGISIYPNPSSDYLTIDIPVELNGRSMEVSLFDMSGRQVLQQFIQPGKATLSHNLEAGHYQVRIASGSEILLNQPLVIH